MLQFKTPSVRRPSVAHLYVQMLKVVVLMTFFAEAVRSKVKDRMTALAASLSVLLFGVFGSAFAQMKGDGKTNPDEIINTAVCGTDGWLGWFTSTKFLVVILVAGLVSYFIGKAVGKRDNDGILGALIAVCGLGAIRILVKIVTSC